MDNIEDEMSSKIEDLNNMQKLSNNIQQEIDDGKASDYLQQNNLDVLQQMQIKQLQELQKIQELQLKTKKNEEEVVVEEKIVKKENSLSSNKIMKICQDPLIILALYIFISHPTILNLIGNYVPNLIEGEDGISLSNLFFRGAILVSIYFGLKTFILN